MFKEKQHEEMPNEKLLKDGFHFNYDTKHPGQKVKIVKAFSFQEE